MPDALLKSTALSKLKRLHERGSNERSIANTILDAGLLCHIGYVIEGKPVVTPTAYWRSEDYVYWHGSSASRMLRAQSEGVAVSFTVSHLDGLVLARSAFHHSLNYRSVMLFGTAEWVDDDQHKREALKAFVDRLYPERWSQLRAMTDQEVKATRVLRLRIDEGSVKVRTGPPVDDAGDLTNGAWAGVIPCLNTLGLPEPDPHTATIIAPPVVSLF